METVGEGLRERISSRVAFLMGKVVGVVKTVSSTAAGPGGGAGITLVLATGLSSVLGDRTMATGGLDTTGAVAPNFSKFSPPGGGLDLVGLGFIFDLEEVSFFLCPPEPPPPTGLFKSVCTAASASNSHLIIVSLTAIKTMKISINSVK